MTAHDLVIIGGVGTLMTLPISNTWKLVISIVLFLFGLFGKGLNLI